MLAAGTGLRVDRLGDLRAVLAVVVLFFGERLAVFVVVLGFAALFLLDRVVVADLPLAVGPFLGRTLGDLLAPPSPWLLNRVHPQQVRLCSPGTLAGEAATCIPYTLPAISRRQNPSSLFAGRSLPPRADFNRGSLNVD